MKRILIFLLSTILVSASLAQGGSSGKFRQSPIINGGVDYVTMPAVKKELGLSEAVAKKFREKLAAGTRATGAFFKGVRQDDKKALAAAMEKQAQAMEKVQNECLAMLTPAQRTRLRQITIQRTVWKSMFHPEIRKELGLDEAQSKKIAELTQANFRSFTRTQPPTKSKDGVVSLQEVFRKEEALNARNDAGITPILTPAQQAKWKAMKGKPFHLDLAGMVRIVNPDGSTRKAGRSG